MAIGGLAPDLSTLPKISRGKDCFLVANSNSVRGFLRPWVGPSVRGSVSVRRFSKTANSTKFKGNLRKFNNIQQNSRLFATVGRVTTLLCPILLELLAGTYFL